MSGQDGTWVSLGDYCDLKTLALTDQIVAAFVDESDGARAIFDQLIAEAFRHLTDVQMQRLDDALRIARQ